MSIGSTFNVVKCHLSNVFRNEFTYVKSCGAFAQRHQSAICILQDGFHKQNGCVDQLDECDDFEKGRCNMTVLCLQLT